MRTAKHPSPSARRRARSRGIRFMATLMLACLPLLAGCGEPPMPVPISRIQLTVLGDSISAGHQNGCTVVDQQDFGYAKVIARQARLKLDLPYISAPGARPCMIIQEDFNLLSTRRQPVPDPDGILPEGDPDDARTWGTRLDPTLASGNLSSPGTRIVDAIDPAPAAWGTPPPEGYHWMFGLDYLAMWSLFADTPDKDPNTSLLDQALARIHQSSTDSDMVILWLGSNDALWSALAGVDYLVTPLPAFQAAYDAVLGALTATGANVVVANIPDLTVAPHFMPAADAVGLFGQDLGSVGPLLGLDETDYVVSSTGWPEIYAILAGLKPGPLPDDIGTDGKDVVLRAPEVAAIQAQIAAYNAVIQERAQHYGALQVDVAGLLENAHQNGYPLGPEVLGTGYCEGIFSLDGVHPSKTGYTIVANTFIRAINARFGHRIPLASEAAAQATEIPRNLCLAS